jgi:hypothetical protein
VRRHPPPVLVALGDKLHAARRSNSARKDASIMPNSRYRRAPLRASPAGGGTGT